jgi:monoamine oxidase
MLTRREFLRRAGSAAVASALVPGPAWASRRRSCVVVGAGLAGLAAARALRGEGWEVVVLEARERTGGRVLSYRFPRQPGLVCELGAEWIGASHERMLALCREFGLPLQEHRFATWLLRDGTVSGPDGWGFSPRAEAAWEAFREEFEGYGDEERARLDRSDWWTHLQRIGFSEDDLRLRDLMDSTDFGESIRHVSAYAAAAEYFESSPANEMDFRIVGGNSRLVDELVRRVGPESIRLGAAVEEIAQTAAGVAVRAGGEVYRADACICTVPARLLGGIRFDPPLPAAQTAAAEQLQYARIIKNSVLFDRRFWGREDFSLVSDATSHFYFHSTQRQPGRAGILCSYAVGDKADVLAAQGDRRRTAIVAGDLLPLNRRAERFARGIASYAWQRDPWTRGAYALYRPGQWFELRPLLQRPHGRVLFAGEHLADWQGFMEGAVVTGEEAARALLE